MVKLIKAGKAEVLRFIRDREFVTIHDLMERFGYKYNGAVKRLRTLAQEGLITQWIERGQWSPTQDGYRRAEYYDRQGK